MTQKVSIGVSADLDASAIERKLNELGQKIAQSNKLTFSPIQGSSLEDLDKMLKQFEQLQRVQGDLRRRMRDTGQADRSLINVDWDQLYADPASRARQMRKAFEYSTGATFHEPVPQPTRPDAPTRPSQPDGGKRPGSGGGLGGVGVNVAQAGLRAAGPVGGVAAGALGTGMAAGFGAGLMGLLGGLAALGVGKLVGAATENIGKAEDNSVALDRLKRTIGDVNISFDGLKSVVNGSANDLKITYAESIKLGTEFAKLSNLTADQSNEISDELKTGVGFARSYGLDPSQGVGMLGQMRGIGVTTNTQESRRFALLIGETIAKSDAFSKADEVMDAISNYATMQTRAGMGVANVGGYAGMFSAMVGSGIPGLDPSGAGALLMRINASLAAGGAKGEASQFFTGMLGGRMGLTPFETEVMREGGAFSTPDEAFGDDSVYARYMGSSKDVGSNSTFLNQTLNQLRGQYGSNREQLAQATANHLGISNRQAMALLSIDPNQMGEMMRFAPNLAGLSASGIGNMSKALYGSADDRTDVANALYRNRDLTSSDRVRLDEAMKGGDADVQRQLLAELSAQYGQERTQGSDIRDSKNALDNIKTSIADKLVPIALEMRHGIMSLAGVGDGVSSEDIMRRVINADSKSRERAILGRHDPAIAALEDEREELIQRTRLATPERLHHTYHDRPDIVEEKIREREENIKRLHEVEVELLSLEKEKARDLEREAAVRESQIRQMEESMAAQREMDAERQRAADILASGGSYGSGSPYSAAPSGGGAPSDSGRFMGNRSGGGGGANGNVKKFVEEYGPLAQRVADELGVPVEAVLGQWGLETGWGKSVIPGTNNLGNIKDFSGKGPKAKDNMTGSVDSYRAYDSADGFGDDFIKLLKNKRYSGVQGAQTPEEYYDALKKGGYAEDPNYVNKGVAAANAARRAMGTPMPPDAQHNINERNATHVTVEPLEVIHRNEKGQEVAPPQTLNTRVQSNWGR